MFQQIQVLANITFITDITDQVKKSLSYTYIRHTVMELFHSKINFVNGYHKQG